MLILVSAIELLCNGRSRYYSECKDNHSYNP